MTIGHPKPPATPEKRPKAIPRGKPPKRSKVRATRKSKPRFGNAYTQPEWRAKVREIRQRSRGICEAQVACGGDPVSGDPHHLRYQREFRGWKRLMVPNDALVDCCRRCHRWFEAQKP